MSAPPTGLRRATSAWSSWATGCSASPSPSCCSRPSPKRPEGELSRRLAELVRRETCADIALAWDVGPYLQLGGRRGALGRAAQPHHPGRRLRVDDRRGVPRRRLRGGARRSSRAPSPSGCTPRASPSATRRAALQEWAQGRGLPAPTYDDGRALGPDHAPVFRIAGQGRGPSRPRSGTGRRSARRNRTPRETFSCARASWNGGRRHGGPDRA